MNSSARPAGAKHGQIIQRIRTDIIRGKLAPGQMLPGHAGLSRQMHVAPMTVRIALRQLSHEGWLVTRERVGTFVAARPPHLSNYALVFPFDPVAPAEEETPQWSKYYRTLTTAAAELQRELGPRLTIYHGVSHHADSEDRQRLVDRIRSHRLAGIIFANNPHALAGTPILDEPGIPRVTLATRQELPHVPAMGFDESGWFTAAVDWLRRRGRRRIAVVGISNDAESPGLLASQLNCPSYWQQWVDWRNPAAASNCVQLLMRGPAGQRPNGLLVRDDNLIEGVTAGLVAAGVRVPADLDVVAHANFPLAARPVLPFHLLGYDLGAALRLGLDLIDRQRRGEAVAGLTALPAVTESIGKKLQEIQPCRSNS